jgi:ferritin-like metal-binding protein YciE
MRGSAVRVRARWSPRSPTNFAACADPRIYRVAKIGIVQNERWVFRHRTRTADACLSNLILKSGWHGFCKEWAKIKQRNSMVNMLDSIRQTFLPSKITTLDELFIEQLQDLYSAENQLIEALPKMAFAAHAAPLKAGFKLHLTQTKEHARRLERILKSLKQSPGGTTCRAMEGLIKEGREMISEDAVPTVKDAGLIAAAQRVEHYEIAGYGCVREFATLLGHREAAATLGKTLKEEGDTDKKLTAAAKTLNVKALKPKTPKKK